MTALADPPRIQPAYLHVPEFAYTDGDQVAGLADEAGYGPDADQRMILDVIFAKDERARSVAFESWVIACRQNLKTGLMKQAVIGWAFLFKEDPIVWTAHEWDPVLNETASELEDIISGYRWMARRVRYFHRGERTQRIGLKNGSTIIFKTRTKGSGRGLAGAKAVLDEGWAIQATHMGALIPTMAARSMNGDPQILGGSSAAHAESDVLHEKIERGREAATNPAVGAQERRLLYVEYCAPDPEVTCDLGSKCTHKIRTPGCGCDKPVYIAMANPAVGRRIAMDYILESERPALGEQYGRERMGWHDTPEKDVKVIPVVDWAAAQDVNSEPVGPVVLAVVYAADQREAAIGLAGKRPDATWHVEIADLVPVGQVITRAAQIIARAEETDRPVAGIVVDPHGYEAECIKGLLDLEKVDLDGEEHEVLIVRQKPNDPPWVPGHPARLIAPSATDVATAFSGFRRSLSQSHDLFHRGQDDLTLAVMGGMPRDVGDAGQAWGRRKSGTDISPAVAVTAARWGWESLAPEIDDQPGVWAL